MKWVIEGQVGLCPVCNCPIQRLCSAGTPKGTVEEAVIVHAQRVHPEEIPCV